MSESNTYTKRQFFEKAFDKGKKLAGALAVAQMVPLISVACVPSTEDKLRNFGDTLPKRVGNTTWTGQWRVIRGATSKAQIEGYYDKDGRFRHKINLVEIGDRTVENQPLTLDQQMVLFKKEVNHLYSYEFIDTKLAQKLNLEKYPPAEVHVLADGLAALTLTPDEQRMLYFNYSDYDRQRQVFSPGEFVVWDGETLNLKIIAAVDIMSTKMPVKVINPEGIKTIGPDLIALARAGNW